MENTVLTHGISVFHRNLSNGQKFEKGDYLYIFIKLGIFAV